MLNLKIRNGVMIDGAKMPCAQADLGIQGDRITAIGNLAETEAQVTIDAAGHIVAPGFVDVQKNNKDLFDSTSQNGLSLEYCRIYHATPVVSRAAVGAVLPRR